MKKKNSTSNHIKRLKNAWRYIQDSRHYILFVAALFLVSALIAYFMPNRFMFLDDFLKDLVDKTKDLSGFSLIAFIFYNNTISSLFGLCAGIFFGIFPTLNALLNGAVIGYVVSKASAIDGLGVLWRLVPHGIFEIPAIFISLGLGTRLGMSFFSHAWKRILVERALLSFYVFVYVVLPLLVIAAIIEGTLITLTG